MDSLSVHEISDSTDGDPRLEVKTKRTPPTAGSPFVPTEPQGIDIMGDLWRLHADELTWLAQRERPVVKPGEAYFPKVRICCGSWDEIYIVSTKHMS